MKKACDMSRKRKATMPYIPSRKEKEEGGGRNNLVKKKSLHTRKFEKGGTFTEGRLPNLAPRKRGKKR